MPGPIILLDPPAIERATARIAHEIKERNPTNQHVALIGIARGGVHLAKRLASLLSGLWQHPVPMGCLDVGMHRDDLHQQATPNLHPTDMPFNVDDKTVVLVDDVLFRGRTTRAALDALNDFGRPRRVQLAVLIDRGHRELPIKADFVGKNVPTSLHERINVKLREEGGEDVVYLEKQ